MSSVDLNQRERTDMDEDTQAPEEAIEAPEEEEHPLTIQQQVDALVKESKANKQSSTAESLIKPEPIKKTHRVITVADPNRNFKWAVPKGHNLEANCTNCFHCAQVGKKYWCRLDPVVNMMPETYCCSRHPQYKTVELKPLERKKPGPKPKTAAK